MMAIEIITKRVKSFAGLFSDTSLTKKASLNALTSGSEYVAKLVIGFLITPLMVAGFGDYFYGVWQVMNRLFSYISTTVGATSPLEWTLAKDQASTDYDQKRSFVGSSLVIWGLFLPLIGIAGGIITWFAPAWLDTPSQYIWTVRSVAGLFIIAEVFNGPTFLPFAILRGQNLGYRRLGLSVILIFFNGGLTWLALFLNTGIIGVSVSALIQVIIAGIFYFILCKKSIHWLGIKRPSIAVVKRFLSLSGWFFAGDIIANITFASDVVVLGLLSSVESVTSYTLTKYIPETLISFIAIIVIGIIPGLGGIIGTGDMKKASQIRGEVFSLTWLIVTVLGTCILIWNRSFLGLWVGSNQYVGTFPNLLIVIVVAQFVMIRTDGSIIDLTLRVQRKVLLGALSVFVSIVGSCVLVGFYKIGVVGVCIGLLLGRLILSFAYPSIVSRYLGISLTDQFKRIIRPIFVMVLMFIGGCLIDFELQSFALTGLKGWILLGLGAGASAILVSVMAFYIGFSNDQRNKILFRIKAVLSK